MEKICNICKCKLYKQFLCGKIILGMLGKYSFIPEGGASSVMTLSV